MRAAMQVANAVNPFDHQGDQEEEPIHHHAVGMVVLDMFHPIKILGVIESLILDLPAALSPFEERHGRKLGDRKKCAFKLLRQ